MENKTSIGEGHGVAGRYAGLPDPYGEATHAQIVIVPVPFDQTSTYQQGSDKGPEALIEASRNMELYDVETKEEVYLKGIFTDLPIIAGTSEKMLEDTYRRVLEWIKKGKFVCTLGGEHAISYAPIRAHAEHYGALTVLQLDAHADLQPAYEGNPWSHASVMARVHEIPQVTKVVSVGIRSMSSEENAHVDAANTFFAHQLDQHGVWMDDVIEKLENPVYITFDLDAFDSGIMPSTGTPEPGGLNWNQTMQFLKRVMQERQVVGFDVVELCPQAGNHAPDYLAAKLVYKMLNYRFAEKR